MIRYAPSVIKLGKNNFFRVYSPIGFLDRSKNPFRPYYKAAIFYSTYIRKFDKNLLLNARYITHWIDVDMSGKVTNKDLLNIAESLIKTYAGAKMVITSRIHAGLPCLGLDTPVIFISNKEVTDDKSSFNTPGRLDGIIDLFRVLNLEDGIFQTNDEVLSKYDKINENTSFENKSSWKKYANKLNKVVTKFMK